jgi:5,10-methylenetetrahydrofolate reductase
MKAIKISTLVIVAGFVGLFGYANLRQLSVVEKLKPVKLISWDIAQSLNASEKQKLEQRISAVPGITACSFSKEGNVATVIFHPEKISESTVEAALLKEKKFDVSLRDLSASAGCPIHKINSSLYSFLSSLDIRH